MVAKSLLAVLSVAVLSNCAFPRGFAIKSKKGAVCERCGSDKGLVTAHRIHGDDSAGFMILCRLCEVVEHAQAYFDGSTDNGLNPELNRQAARKQAGNLDGEQLQILVDTLGLENARKISKKV